MKNKILAAGFLLAVLTLSVVSAYAACVREEDHRYGSWRFKTLPSCTTQGHAFKYCQKCDHWEQKRTPKLPHPVGMWTVTLEPTCTAEGKMEGTCLVCGHLSRKSVEMLPHLLGEMTAVEEPTCTANGKGQSVCLICGKKVSQRLGKLGHDWGEIGVTREPTCHKTGSGEVSCLRCGKSQTQSLERLTHAYGDFEIISEPSGKKKGVKEAACALCGDTRTERFYWEGTLYQDMKPCEEVIRLQEMLRDLGYYSGSIRSGTFGGMTGKAVAKFQRACGMEATEVADPDTIAAIEAAWEEKTGKTEGSK